MPQFFIHQGSPTTSTRLIAEPEWALAVRSMVGGHDADGALAQRLVESFVERLRSCLGEGAPSSEQIAQVVRDAVDAAGAEGSDGVLFTLLVTGADAVRVFNVGPQRTFLASGQEPTTVVTPQSLAEEVRRKGLSPAPEHARISTRLANRATTASDIDVAEVAMSADTWLVTQLDDRAPPLLLATLPTSFSDMVARLQDNARDVPNSDGDWLVAKS